MANATQTRLFLDAGAQVNARDHNEDTALTASAQDDEEECVKLLLDHGADFRIKNNAGDTALSLAIRGQYPALIRLLKAHGATK